MTALRSPLGRKVSLCAVLASLVLFGPARSERAEANDPTIPGNATITLENLAAAALPPGALPRAEGSKLKVFLMPAGNSWSDTEKLPPVRFRYKETLRASGKILIAGGMLKRGLTFSAEMYDATTDTWLAKSQVSTGRGQSSTALPNNGRILLWWGVIVPF